MAGERLLILEDERAAARRPASALQAERFQAPWAGSGQRGLELVAPFDPHLIMLDICLPDMSGFDVRPRSQGRRQPNLMLTVRAEKGGKVLGRELGRGGDWS